MGALGPVGFAILVWGVVGLVIAVLLYEVVVVIRDLRSRGAATR